MNADPHPISKRSHVNSLSESLSSSSLYLISGSSNIKKKLHAITLSTIYTTLIGKFREKGGVIGSVRSLRAPPSVTHDYLLREYVRSRSIYSTLCVALRILNTFLVYACFQTARFYRPLWRRL